MIDKQLFRFYISYKLDGKVFIEWVEGINLRHAKDKIQFKYSDATDLMDWTNEKEEDLQKYLHKVASHGLNIAHVTLNQPKS
ncbi:MAG: hypothetical protein ACFCUU_09590 [Cyclobacteriaceae bacterium]